MESSIKYRMAFASLKGMNRFLAMEILRRTETEEAFFSMNERRLSAMLGFNNRILGDSYRNEAIVAAEKELDFISANDIRTIYFNDEAYPSRLSECDDAPLMLFGLGNCDLNKGRTMAVVGTRHATPYGLDFVTRMIESIAEKVAEPVTIVSGLAFGIDIAAHRAAIKCGLPTVAVLAHGLNMIYPAQHRSAAIDIVKSGGMLLTDYRSSDAVHKGNFVARNRIVAGLCDCTVVVESADKGGALITAGIASAYNRDVFALPGRISDRYSAGCNRLISDNVAALIESGDNIIDMMHWPVKEVESTQRELFPVLTDDEQLVVDFLVEKGEAQINQLSVALNRNVAKLMALLIEMEFKGIVITYPGGRYRLA